MPRNYSAQKGASQPLALENSCVRPRIINITYYRVVELVDQYVTAEEC